MKLKPLSYKKVAKRLVDLGYHPVRQSGSHVIFKNISGRITVVPNHPGEKIGRGLLRKILRDIEVSPEEFMKGI